jgi:alginate O-acetyltransferase complex protein AlgI
MLFNSLPFAAFLVLTFALYYLPGLQRYQVQVLIGASFVFYAWTLPALLLLLVSSVFVNAWVSYRVGRDAPSVAWRWAFAGVVANLSVIAFFKYGGLLANTIEQLATGRVDWPLVIPLPIGISFYTFEGISLLVDTLRQRRSDQHRFEIEEDFGRHLRNTALFVAFFPHLIAGPILKARHFFPQIGSKRFRDIPWEIAIRTLVVGYFLKTVVADNLKDYTFWISYPSFEALTSRDIH